MTLISYRLALFPLTATVIAVILIVSYRWSEEHFTRAKLQITAVSVDGWFRENRKEEETALQSPWQKVPKFEIYIRMMRETVFVNEYKGWFLKGFTQHFPPERWSDSLVIGLDQERSSENMDQINLQYIFPYPRIYLHEPLNLYGLEVPGFKELLELFYPEKYIKAEYVGYVDTDTFFFTTVTPDSLFEKGKPVITSLVSDSDSLYGFSATQYLLGFKEVVRCTDYNPIVLKRRHITELREMITKRANQSLETILTVIYKLGFENSIRYNLLCNYIWYFHRQDYAFHFHLPNNAFDYSPTEGKGKSNYVLTYLQHVNAYHPERWIPKPRISVNTRFFQGEYFRPFKEEGHSMVSCEKLCTMLLKSYCHTVGFDYGSECCKEYNRSEVFHDLYISKQYSKEWNQTAMNHQKMYFADAKRMIQYQRRKGHPIFGREAKEYVCPALT